MTNNLKLEIEKSQQSAELLHSSMKDLYHELVRENPLAAELFWEKLNMAGHLLDALTHLQILAGTPPPLQTTLK